MVPARIWEPGKGEENTVRSVGSRGEGQRKRARKKEGERERCGERERE